MNSYSPLEQFTVRARHTRFIVINRQWWRGGLEGVYHQLAGCIEWRCDKNKALSEFKERVLPSLRLAVMICWDALGYAYTEAHTHLNNAKNSVRRISQAGLDFWRIKCSPLFGVFRYFREFWWTRDLKRWRVQKMDEFTERDESATPTFFEKYEEGLWLG